MLALAAIFLFTLMASATAVWLYRKVSGWHGFTTTVVGRPHSGSRTKMGLQHGFVHLTAKYKGQTTAKPRGQTKLKRHRAPKGGYKAPWGW